MTGCGGGGAGAGTFRLGGGLALRDGPDERRGILFNSFLNQ